MQALFWGLERMEEKIGIGIAIGIESNGMFHFDTDPDSD